VTRVSLPASPGRMHIHSARGISDNGALVSDQGLSARIAFVGTQATIIFFTSASDADTWA
jgi:hypothetical protein